MNLRPATAGDATDIVRLENELFGADAWSAATVEQSLAADMVLVSEPAGYVVVSVAGEVADLQRIAVDPHHRRCGVARALLAAARAAAQTEGAERMLLEVSEHNAGALACYAADGFAEIDRRRRYYRDGADAVVMSRILS